MSTSPRLAVGPIQCGVDHRPALWAVLDALDQQGIRLQCFSSRACLRDGQGTQVVTGSPPRHLDSWLMSPAACQTAFLRAAAGADLSLVEGSFVACPGQTMGGQLPILCDWLKLPRVGIVDGSLLDACRLPQCPSVDALLIDQIRSPGDFYLKQTLVESMWGIPVLGGIEQLFAARQVIGALQPGSPPPRELCLRWAIPCCVIFGHRDCWN